ncbi:angiopoietin-1 receptor-like [Acanthaster planci]|uniref:Angiopoietin-1 receptor-like n=1 Tax=Acanthaster planci TaxID=133434 RepID=A0A8B7XQB6_ACAPL|nr:angiopoietin-1 receptor-like [Acanthaster planci]
MALASPRIACPTQLAVLAVLFRVMSNGFVWAQSTSSHSPQPDLNMCNNFPCENGGACNGNSDSYTCTCQPAFTGDRCETLLDACFSRPCLNGGTCQAEGSEYHCVCRIGFSGSTCQQDPCSSSPCMNGGTCVGNSISYDCACPAGFTGVNCQSRELNVCMSSPCKNGGTCHQGTSVRYNCTCPPEFTGENCQQPIPSLFKSCPRDIAVNLPVGETHAYILWEVPLVKSDYEYVLVSSNYEPGSSFSIGRHRVIYRCIGHCSTEDGHAVKWECAFNVNVAEIPGSVIKYCPKDIQVDLPYGQHEAFVTWAQPQVFGGGIHVVRVVLAAVNRETSPWVRFSVGNHTLIYQLQQGTSEWEESCSFNIEVTDNGVHTGGTIQCDTYTTTLVLGAAMFVVSVACICLCFCFIRTRRQLSSRGSSRAMVPLDAISSNSKTINNGSSFSDPINRPRYQYQTDPKQLPPVPPPKPGLPLEDNAYEALDNYGYLSLEPKMQNTGMCQLPRAVYQKPKGINEY